MHEPARCDQCGQPAKVHETLADAQPASAMHFCAQHAPPHIKHALGDVCRTVLGTAEKREHAVQALAEQLGIEQEQVRQTLNQGLARLLDG
jgi:hypothetical protein